MALTPAQRRKRAEANRAVVEAQKLQGLGLQPFGGAPAQTTSLASGPDRTKGWRRRKRQGRSIPGMPTNQGPAGPEVGPQGPMGPSPGSPIPQIVDTSRDQFLGSFGAIENLRNMLGPNLQSFGNLLRPNASGLPQILDTANNPALNSQIEAAIRPLGRQFQEAIIPGVRGNFTQGGAFGSSRQGIAEGLAAKELIQQSGDISGRLAGESYARGLDALTQGASSAGDLMGRLIQQQQFGAALGPEIAQLQRMPSDILSEVDRNRRLEEQGGIDEVTRRIMENLFGPLGIAQTGLGVAGGLTPDSTTSSGINSQGRGNTARNAIGGAASGAALGSFGGPAGMGIGALLGLMMGIV